MKWIKIFFLSFLNLVPPVYCGAQIIDLGECTVDGVSLSGFEELETIIGEARIVIIGEQNHGVGTDYKSFAFLVKFLHEKMGFNVIAQEHCFHYFGTINSNLAKGETAQAYRNGMYWPQGKAQEQDLLFDYIDGQITTKNPIYMEGFDPRIFQRKEMSAYWDSLLNTEGSDLLAHKEEYLRHLRTVLRYEYQDTITSLSEKKQFLSDTDSIIHQMVKKSYPSRTIQTMKNLKSYSKNAWSLEGYSMQDVDRFHEREHQMVENILWLSKVMYPNEKIILRMHNGHAAKNLHQLEKAIPDSLLKRKLNVGTRLNQIYGSSCIHIATTYYSGTYCKWDFKPKNIPQPKSNAIEANLHRKGYEYAYVDLTKKQNRKFYMFHSDFNSWVDSGRIKARFGQLFDGLIFIDNVQLPTEITTE